MGYIKYQIEEKEVNFGDGNWYYTGEKRISNTIAGRYLDSGSCENEGETCYKFINRYNDGRTHAIRYDGYALNSDISRSEFYPQGDVFKNSGMTSSVIGDCTTSLDDITSVSPAISLTSLTFGDNVAYIGNNFFKNCNSLTSLSLPTKLLIIGENTFQGCSGITSVTIPDSVITVGQSAFKDCISLSSITIGSNVTSIGSSAFTNSYIPSSNFINNSSLDEVANNYWGCIIIDYDINGLCIKDNRVVKYRGYDTSVVIPDIVTNIDDSAFASCTGLTSITIPDSVATIGSNAFYNCYRLTNCTIGSGVTYVGSNAFYNCYWITNLSINSNAATNDVFSELPLLESLVIGNKVTRIGGWAFSGCTNLTSVTIGNKVTSIGSGAFSGCSGLQNIDIPDSVTSIGDRAFRYCRSLTSVTIGSGVTTINGEAFEYCSGITSLNIPDSVTVIDTFAFRHCSGLTSLTIGSGIESFGEGAFGNCRGLNTITILATKPPVVQSYNSFHGTFCPIYVPAQSVNAYKKSKNWKNYVSRLQPIPNS